MILIIVIIMIMMIIIMILIITAFFQDAEVLSAIEEDVTSEDHYGRIHPYTLAHHKALKSNVIV